MIRRALTIAGSDSGAGAGIQADLKTFAAFGVYGSSVLTAVTAQNTLGVTSVFELPTEVVAAQIDAVMTDIGADAVKTGMLASSAIIHIVADRLQRYGVHRLVVDPVMVSKSRTKLLQPEAIEVLRERLAPMAYLLTPNLDEAEVLLNRAVRSVGDMRQAAADLAAMGAQNVLVKGGHLAGDPVDVLFDGTGFREFRAARVETINTHGTGCTFSSAVAACLAKGMELANAVQTAKQYVTGAITASFPIGAGRSPVHHFYRSWESGGPAR